MERYSLTQLKAVVELFGYQAISIENKDSFLDEVITNLPERAPIEGSCNYYIQKRIYLQQPKKKMLHALSTTVVQLS